MDALKVAWARVRASAGLFAHSAFDDLEAELTKIAGELETRLTAVEVALGLKAPAPPAPAPAMPDVAAISAMLAPMLAQILGSLTPAPPAADKPAA